MNKKSLLLFLMAAFLLSACSFKWNPFRKKSKTPISAAAVTAPKGEQRSQKERTALLKKVQANQATYQSFSAKAKVNAEMKESALNLGTSIRIKPGKIIWMSITAIAGIEVARVYITPDSVKLLDRLHSTYHKYPFSYLHSMVNSDIDFAALEALLVGNIAPAFLNSDLSLLKDSSKSTLKGVSPSMSYAFSLTDKAQLQTSFFSDKAYNQDLRVDYADWKSIDKTVLPMSIKMLSKMGQDVVKADITYTKIELDKALEFPFTVPGKFEEK